MDPRDLLGPPLFQIGDIIQSKYDRPVVIYGIKTRKGFHTYQCIRLDKEMKQINGDKCTYTQLSVSRFEVVGQIPAVQILYGKKVI